MQSHLHHVMLYVIAADKEIKFIVSLDAYTRVAGALRYREIESCTREKEREEKKNETRLEYFTRAHSHPTCIVLICVSSRAKLAVTGTPF